MSESPYRLFDYYDYEDRDLFFGRDEEIARMVGDILSARLLVLFAPSGSGKSSLLRAGVRPALEKKGFEAVFTRVGENPIRSIIDAIESLKRSSTKGAKTISDAIKGPDVFKGPVKDRERAVIIFIDQFEELFTHFKPESAERSNFPRLLAEALFDPSLKIYFVLSLRSDYFVMLNEFREHIPTIFHNNTNLELKPFDDANAYEAIVGPSEIPGSQFAWEPGLPEQIIQDLKSTEINPRENGVFPITLQMVCHTLWSRLENGSGTITADSYRTAGFAKGIINNRVLDTLNAVRSGDRRLLCQLLREIVTKDGLKRIQPLDRLESVIGNRKRDSLNRLLERFEQDLLLTKHPSRGKTWVELRHDYLAGRMKPWLEEEEKRLDTARRRNSMIAAIASAVLAATGFWLWYDYHTYVGVLGAKAHLPQPEDQLVVQRPSRLWPLRIETGYPRELLQMGGVPWDRFEVPNALADWSAVAIRLADPARERYELATQLDEFAPNTRIAGKTNLNVASVNALANADIGYYEAADEKVLEFVLSVLANGNADAKRSAARGLGNLSATASLERVKATVPALLASLKDEDTLVKSSALEALGRLGQRVPEGSLGEVTACLLAALKDPSSIVTSSAADTLGQSGQKLPQGSLGEVAAALLTVDKDPDSDVAHSAARALNELGRTLPEERISEFTATLLTAVKDSGSPAKRSALDALGGLGRRMPEGSAGEVTTTLLTSLKDSDPLIKSSAAYALGQLGQGFPAGRVGELATALLAALKDATSNSEVRRSAATALGELGEKMPDGIVGEVTTALLTSLKDSDRRVRSSAAYSTGEIAQRLPEGRVGELMAALLAAFKDPGPYFGSRDSFADALGKLGQRLPARSVGEIVAAMLTSLKDSESSVNDALVRFGHKLPVGRFGEFTAAMLTNLKDPASNVHVRSSVANALSQLVENLPAGRIEEVSSALLAALKEPDYLVSSSAADALGQLAQRLPEGPVGHLTGALLAVLKDTEYKTGVRDSAANVLGRLGQKLPERGVEEVTSALLTALKDSAPDSNIRKSAVSALGQLGQKLPEGRVGEVAAALIVVLKDSTSDSDVRSIAVRALGQLGPKLPQEHVRDATAALLATLKEPKFTDAVTDALGSLKDRLDEPLLREIVFRLHVGALREHGFRYADFKIRAIRELTRDETRVETPFLLKSLTDSESEKRIFAVHALARRSLGELQLEQIRELRDDHQGRPWVRMAALDALMEIEREKAMRQQDKEPKIKRTYVR
jgi:HEAT repeat protein